MTTNGNDGGPSWDEARQLGQLFMMGFDGTAVNEQVKVLIEKHYVGSIMLTAKNLKSAEQTTALVRDLQNLAHNAGHPVPLLIAIDQENGGVNSLYDERYIRQFPSAMGMAATGSKQLAKYVARATAQELAACGVNWILGPVMDVLTNARSQPLGVRSFGDDPQEVSAYGAETLRGYQEGGLATCAKHFPSYGNLEFFGAPTDVPTITESLEHLSQTALVSFRNAISQGVDAMMVGGVALSSTSMNIMHACLSEQIVHDLLRREMHFNGVVVSECLEMEALSRNIGISGGTVMAFNAGCDVILTCRSLNVQKEAITGLKAGLDNGMIEQSRVQESLERILNLKARYASWDKALSPTGIEQLTRLEPLHTNLSTKAYSKSITVVRDLKGYLPLSRTISEHEELLLLTPLVKPLPASAAYQSLQDSYLWQDVDFGDGDVDSSVMNGEQVFRELGRSLARQRNGKVSHTSYTANGLRPIHENLLERAAAVIVVTADAGRNIYQQGFTKHIRTLCKLAVNAEGKRREVPCIVIAVSSPFDFATDMNIGTYICTYDFTETALQTLVKVLYGEMSPLGVLPGTTSQIPKTTQARQQWLIEAFDEERDVAALDRLLKAAAKAYKSDANFLEHATSSSFLLQDPNIDEAHFVYRNSTTKELFGFCATYYVRSSNTGRIGAIIVDPARRKKSIGHSLHDRAIRALLQRKNARKFKIGSRLPSIFPGIPKADREEYKTLRQWFAKIGWNMAQSRTLTSMHIENVTAWTPPDGLGQALTNTNTKYDLINGVEHVNSIMEHVEKCAHSDVQAMYRMALSNKEGCALIRARKASDASILGTVILFKNGSKIAPYITEVQVTEKLVGGLSSPVVSVLDPEEKSNLTKGLMLLGARQLKRQGMQKVFLDYVDDGTILKDLQALGFTMQHTFEEVSSQPTHWTMTAPA